MTRAAFAVLLTHWWRHPLQLTALIGGLAMATALFAGVQAINSEARIAYGQANAALSLTAQGQITAPNGQAVPLADYATLRRAGWPVVPLIEGRLTAAAGEVTLLGIDPLNPPVGLGAASPGGAVDVVAFLRGMVGLADAQTTRLWQGQAGLPELVDQPLGQTNVIVLDIARAAELLAVGPDPTRLVLVGPPPMTPSLSSLAPGLALSGPDVRPDPAELTESFHLNLAAFGLLSFVVGLFIVQGVVNLAFAQRRASLAQLRLLGLPLRHLVVLLAVEQTVMALVAGGIGILAGYGLAAALMPDIAATLAGLYGAEIDGALQFRAQWWALALGMAVLGSALASITMFLTLPQTHVLAGPPAGRLGAVRRMTRRLGLAGAACLCAASILAVFGQGLVAGFAVLAAVLAGAALGLPFVLERSAAWGERLSTGPLAQWFWADMRLQLSGLSLALMALLLALATTIGVATMVSSFRLTFVAFLDQRLTADLYVELRSEADLARLSALEAVLAMPVHRADAVVAGHPVGVTGTPLPPQAQTAWRFLEAVDDPWAALAAGEGLLISEQLAHRANLSLGDRVVLRPDLRLPIVAIYADYGNPRGHIRLGEAVFTASYPNHPVTAVTLYTPEPQALHEALVAMHGFSAGQITAQQEVKRLALGIFERTFTVTAALSVLTLSVAGFAMLMALTTMAGMRMPHLAPLWAIGVSRGQLGGIELARMVGLALITAVLALPLGLVQAVILLGWINVEAFGWRLPVFLFPGQYAQMIGLAVLTALLAGLWPMLRLLRQPPAALIKSSFG